MEEKENFKSEQCGGTDVHEIVATISWTPLGGARYRVTEDGQDRLTEDGRLRFLG